VASWSEYQPAALVRALVEGGVDFVVIGGVAVVLQAMPRFTKDLDICYSTAQDNLDTLGSVLVALEARLRGIPETVPFVPDGRTLRQTQRGTSCPDGARSAPGRSPTREASGRAGAPSSGCCRRHYRGRAGFPA
jgi:hypothetical protein